MDGSKALGLFLCFKWIIAELSGWFEVSIDLASRVMFALAHRSEPFLHVKAVDANVGCSRGNVWSVGATMGPKTPVGPSCRQDQELERLGLTLPFAEVGFSVGQQCGYRFGNVLSELQVSALPRALVWPPTDQRRAVTKAPT